MVSANIEAVIEHGPGRSKWFVVKLQNGTRSLRWLNSSYWFETPSFFLGAGRPRPQKDMANKVIGGSKNNRCFALSPWPGSPYCPLSLGLCIVPLAWVLRCPLSLGPRIVPSAWVFVLSPWLGSSFCPLSWGPRAVLLALVLTLSL